MFFQNLFVVDDVSKIIKDTVENTIGGNAYQNEKVNVWTGTVVETVLQVLTQLQKPYKYIGQYFKPIYLNYSLISHLDHDFFSIVTCMIMQKNGAGLHTASSCYWNNEMDGSCTVRWENKSMYCIVSVFGLSI